MSTAELSETVAIVTGGSRGIGEAVARELASGGARVAVMGRSQERATQAASRLPGEGHKGYACDVADPQQAAQSVAAVEADLGPVQILINNAGITRDNILLRMKDDEWEDVLATNLKGAFNMTRAVARGMMKRRSGSVVNVTSVIGIMGNAGQANYAASKAGLIGLTKSVARELASRGVRCNAVAPGYIQTDMTSGLDDQTTQRIKERIPLARLGEPADVAGLVRFLVGPKANYITGQVISVDGGMAM